MAFCGSSLSKKKRKTLLENEILKIKEITRFVESDIRDIRNRL